MDVMEFFRRSTGQWRSQRTTHHLPFRRAETGDSLIQVEALEAQDGRIIEICNLHSVDPTLTIGGAFITWHGSMEWDREDENHEGSSVFAILPDSQNLTQGELLRERGYAEVLPVRGRYCMDSEQVLVLSTEYETMSAIERFWFPAPNLRLRTSTIQRFGGFTTASFCAETRVLQTEEDRSMENTSWNGIELYSCFGW